VSEDGFIVIVGACEHNLKDVTVRIPKKKLVVVTGPSGSGKSSLAFDTLFAEGQRRYVESLSSYARQFLGQMDKPKYERIRGLSPTIAIEQKAASNNPRSTVGTITEIYDYLRVLYARVGVQHCHQCGRKVGAQTAEQISRALSELPSGTKLSVFAPLVRGKKGEHDGVMGEAKKKGFVRLRIDGRLVDTGEETVRLDKKSKHDIEALIDRIVVKPGAEARVTDSVEMALREGSGTLIARHAEEDRIYSEHHACHHCGISFDDLSPQSFSFNAPQGACPSCDGLGSRPEMDPDLIVSKPDASIRDGAISVWATSMARGEGWKADWVSSLLRELKVKLDVPWKDLPAEARDAVMWGRRGKQELWEGLAPMLMRRFKAAGSDDMRSYYSRFLSEKPCKACGGRRLRPESRAVRIAEMTIDSLTALTIRGAYEFVRGVSLPREQAAIAAELSKEILARLAFLLDVGLEYLTLGRAAATLSGGESQRIRLASQIGSELEGVIYVLDEPSIGLHPRDNGRLLKTLMKLRDLGNSVVVVEHDEETMRSADWILDFGPGAGEHGGRVVGEGTPADLMRQKSSVTEIGRAHV
jgi:excinuclease ABC subunit A